MMKSKRLLAATFLLGSIVLFTTQNSGEAMAQQPQCWDQSTNRLRDMVPGSISGGSRSRGYDGQLNARRRGSERSTESGGARINGFPVC